MIKIIDKFTKDSLMKLRLWNLLPHDYAPFFRILHIIVAFLILSQIINSNLTETEAIGEHSLEGVITLDAHYFRVRTDYLWFYYVKLDAYSKRFYLLFFMGRA